MVVESMLVTVKMKTPVFLLLDQVYNQSNTIVKKYSTTGSFLEIFKEFQLFISFFQVNLIFNIFLNKKTYLSFPNLDFMSNTCQFQKSQVIMQERPLLKKLSLSRQISCNAFILILFATARFFGGKKWEPPIGKLKKFITEQLV